MQAPRLQPTRFDGAAPFVVAVSGHRDLHPGDVAAVAERIFEALTLIADSLPHSALDFLSPLADGADQLFAAQVLRLRAGSADPGRIRLLVPLPMPLQEYCEQQGQGDRSGYEQRMAPLLQQADAMFVIPDVELERGAALSAFDLPYARLARYLAAHAQLVVAVWDGVRGEAAPGGTLDLVQALLGGFERNRGERSERRPASPDFGRFLHVATRRVKGSAAGPVAASSPLGAMSGEGDDKDPGACIRRAGGELDELNRRHRAAMSRHGSYAQRVSAVRDAVLASVGAGDVARDGALAALARSFAIADLQAESAKRSWRRAWGVIVLGAVLASLSSLLWLLLGERYGALVETASYAAGAGLAIACYFWIARSRRRNAYLCYRALAEGLRVQIAWLASGSAALVGDHYLCKQRGEAGWVRDTLDALTVGLRPETGSPTAVARGWISSQLACLAGPNQSDRLRGVFGRANRALMDVGGDESAAAELLAALGREVLDENDSWLQRYLERPISWHGK